MEIRANDGAPSGAAYEADWQGGDLQGATQMVESVTLRILVSMRFG